MLIEEIISEITSTIMPKVTVANPDEVRANNKALGRKEYVITTPAFDKARSQQLDKQAAQDARQGAGQSYIAKFEPSNANPNANIQAPKNKRPRPIQSIGSV